MKKMLTVLITMALLLTVFTACGEKNDGAGSGSDTTHVHTALEAWDRDLNEHWQLCECGERLNSAEHTFDEEDVCTVCGSEIWDFGDNVYHINNYNEYGDLIRATFYGSNGDAPTEAVYEIEYDDDGNCTFEKYYENGVLISELLYALGEYGVYATKYISYEEDGTRFENEYNENGDVIYMVNFDTDGTKLYESFSEYAEDADGNSYEAKVTDYDYINGEIYIAEYNEYEDQTGRTITDLDGNIILVDRFEFEYDENGDQLWGKLYTNDVLVEEITGYKTVEDGDSYMRFPECRIVYNEDGSKLVTVNGDNGDVATETYYNADGTVEYELSYTYETDDDGNYTFIRVYKGEALVSETEYAFDDDGWNYVAKVTEYNDDGSVTIYEYDADGNEITDETGAEN